MKDIQEDLLQEAKEEFIKDILVGHLAKEKLIIKGILQDQPAIAKREMKSESTADLRACKKIETGEIFKKIPYLRKINRSNIYKTSYNSQEIKILIQKS